MSAPADRRRFDAETASFHALGPEVILAAVASRGFAPSGHLLELNSYENRVYRVGLEDAPPVVAKFYRPGRWTDAAIGEEHAFTRALAEAEIPAVAPLAPGGATLHRHGPYRFALYPCVGGRAPELDDFGALEELGRLIGRVHALGAAARYRHRPAITVERLGEAPVRYLLEHRVVPDALAPSYRAAAANVLDRIRRRFAEAGAVATLRLHGDCHAGNILVCDGLHQLVDFDDSATGPAIQDLWLFLSGDRAFMEAGLSALLEGYRDFRPFDPRELVLVEALRGLRMLHHAGWLARRWSDPAFPRAFPWFGTERYWGEHILALREQAATLDEPPLAWR